MQELGRNTGRSPALGQSPAQNHLPSSSSANQSPAGTVERQSGSLVHCTVCREDFDPQRQKKIQARSARVSDVRVLLLFVGSLNTSLSSQTQSPDTRTAAATSSPSGNASQSAPPPPPPTMSDAQKQTAALLHHKQQLAAIGGHHNLTVSLCDHFFTTSVSVFLHQSQVSPGVRKTQHNVTELC